MISNWFVLGEGFGCEFESLGLRWIYWAPGRLCQEGSLNWGTETQGVVPWVQGQPKHYHRSAISIISDLKKAGIIEILKNKIK